MLQSLLDGLDILVPLITIVTAAVAVGMAIRLLWLAGVISFKITNRGVGK